MKRNKVIAILLTLVMTIIASVPVFAESGTTNGAQQTVQKTETTQTQSTQTKLSEKDAIKKYGYYKGKNATKVPVITYHRVVTNKEKKTKFRYNALAVSKGTFDKQMKWLHKKRYRTINCEEFYLWYKGKIKLPPRSVLITFDDGYKSVADNALPVLKKYKMKGTTFIIGASTAANRKELIPYKELKSLQQRQSNMEFQSHTYHLHNRKSVKASYAAIKKDADKQKAKYGFEYLAYPYGTNTKNMRRAYKAAGIKMAFTYGSNGYATKKQNIYKIRRIKISGNESFSKFKRWFK